MDPKFKKALLFSAVVFPGSGYFYLGRKARGYMCAALTMLILSGIIYDMCSKAILVADKLAQEILMTGTFDIDLMQIRTELLNAPGMFSISMLNDLLTFILVIWLAALFDTYRIGKEQRSYRDLYR